MHYQPKAKVGSRNVYGVEALVRWQHPTLGLLLPDDFIPEAEHTGMIEPITAWVLDESLRQCRLWLDEVGTSHRQCVVGRREPVSPEPAGQLAA